MKARPGLAALVCVIVLLVRFANADSSQEKLADYDGNWRFVLMAPHAFVFGPPEAESVRVAITVEGSTTQLDSLGVLWEQWEDSRFLAFILLADRVAVKGLSSVIDVRPVPLEYDPNDTTKSWSEMTEREKLLKEYPYAVIWGPPEAESVEVVINSCRGCALLDSLAIEYEEFRECLLLANLALSQRRSFQSHLMVEIKPRIQANPIPPNPRILVDREHIFGPAEAESTRVAICTDGRTNELDSAGVVLRPLQGMEGSCYSAAIRLDDYWLLLQLPSVVSIKFRRITRFERFGP